VPFTVEKVPEYTDAPAISIATATALNPIDPPEFATSPAPPHPAHKSPTPTENLKNSPESKVREPKVTLRIPDALFVLLKDCVIPDDFEITAALFWKNALVSWPGVVRSKVMDLIV
jgi:hypothetical protein